MEYTVEEMFRSTLCFIIHTYTSQTSDHLPSNNDLQHRVCWGQRQVPWGQYWGALHAAEHTASPAPLHPPPSPWGLSPAAWFSVGKVYLLQICIYQVIIIYYFSSDRIEERLRCRSCMLKVRLCHASTLISLTLFYKSMVGKYSLCPAMMLWSSTWRLAEWSEPHTSSCWHSEMARSAWLLTRRDSSPTTVTCLLTVPDIFWR